MNVIYERINGLCKSRNTSYTKVCKELNIQPSIIGNLKNDDDRVLRSDTALLIANSFDVGIDYLLGKTDSYEKEIPVTNGDGQDLEKAVSEASERQKELIQRILKYSDDQVTAFLSITQSPPDDQ